MTEFELDDPETSDDDDSDAESELSFRDNGKPGNYLFAVVKDPDMGYVVNVVPTEYWDAEEASADWNLKLEVPGFTQEMEGMYTYDSIDKIAAEVICDVFHRKFEKAGCTFSASFATYFEDAGCIAYKPA